MKKREAILRSRLLHDTHLPSICARQYSCMQIRMSLHLCQTCIEKALVRQNCFMFATSCILHNNYALPLLTA